MSVAMKKSPLLVRRVVIVEALPRLTVAVSASHRNRGRVSIVKNARERMDVIAAYRDVGSYRGAAYLRVDLKAIGRH